MSKFAFLIILIIIYSGLYNLNSVTSQDISQSDETITYALPYDFDEYSIYTADSYATEQWMSAIYAGLLKRNSINHEWEPNLASSMPSISADEVKYVFTLKDNLKFSNGNELNADDVEFSFLVALTPQINTNFYNMFNGFVNNESVNIVDSSNVEFTLIQPMSFPYTLFSFPIIDRLFFEERYNRCLEGVEIDCVWNNPDGTDIVSAGPFMVEEIDSVNEIVIVEVNPFYYDAEILYTDKIVFKKIARKDMAISAIENGSIDILDSQYVPSLTVLSNIVGIKGELVTDLAHQELSLNHLNPYYGTGVAIPGNVNASNSSNFDDALLIRKAMSHIVAREFIVNDNWDGLAMEAASVMPPTSIGFDDTIIYRNYSIDVARKYMEMAGFDYSTLGAESEFNTFENNFFEITMLSPNSAPTSRNLWSADYVRELPKIGIGVKDHVSTGWGEIGPRTFGYGDNEHNPEFPLPPSHEDGGFDILAVSYGWALDWNPTGLYDSSGRCDTGNCGNFYNFDLNEENTNIGALIRSYLGELDFEVRIEKVKEVQQALYENIPVLPILHPMSHWGFNENVVGIDPLLLSISQQDWSQVRKLGFVSNIPVFPTSETVLDFPFGGWPVIVSVALIGRISYIKARKELN